MGKKNYLPYIGGLIFLLLAIYLAGGFQSILDFAGSEDGSKFIQYKQTYELGEPILFNITTGNTQEAVKLQMNAQGAYQAPQENSRDWEQLSTIEEKTLGFRIDDLALSTTEYVSYKVPSVYTNYNTESFNGYNTAPRSVYYFRKSYNRFFNILDTPPNTIEAGQTKINGSEFIEANKVMAEIKIPNTLTAGNHTLEIYWYGTNVYGANCPVYSNYPSQITNFISPYCKHIDRNEFYKPVKYYTRLTIEVLPNETAQPLVQCCDGSIKESANSCPANCIVNQTTNQFQCYDGSIVQNQNECPIIEEVKQNDYLYYISAVAIILIGIGVFVWSFSKKK